VNNRITAIGGDYMAIQCGVCEKYKFVGISLLESNVCLDCEKKIVGMHPNHLQYSVIVERMKAMWRAQQKIEKM
jgi:hypothetical protein